MKSKSIRWQLSLSYAGIALLATLLLGAIMMGILARYFAIQESNYLVETAAEIGDKAFYIIYDKLEDQDLNVLMQRFSFYIDARLRLIDPERMVIADSGSPQPITRIQLDGKSRDEQDTYAKTIYIGRANGSPFSSWIFNFLPDDIGSKPGNGQEIGPRSSQVVTQAFYDKNQELLGYVELSSGPAFGTEILRSVGLSWGIAALVAVLLAGAAGVWVTAASSAPPLKT